MQETNSHSGREAEAEEETTMDATSMAHVDSCQPPCLSCEGTGFIEVIVPGMEDREAYSYCDCPVGEARQEEDEDEAFTAQEGRMEREAGGYQNLGGRA